MSEYFTALTGPVCRASAELLVGGMVDEDKRRELEEEDEEYELLNPIDPPASPPAG